MSDREEILELYEELLRITSALESHNIEYALCGGLAMAIYDHPRATVDIDLLILSDSVDSAFDVVNKLGYDVRGLDMSFANGAIEIRRISKIRPAKRHVLTLDMLLVTPAILDVWESRVEAEIEEGTLSVVSREGLIALKKLRSSGIDMDDIAKLQEDIRDAEN
jgi:hypothetical protein